MHQQEWIVGMFAMKKLMEAAVAFCVLAASMALVSGCAEKNEPMRNSKGECVTELNQVIPCAE
jgi:hypothetical protein